MMMTWRVRFQPSGGTSSAQLIMLYTAWSAFLVLVPDFNLWSVEKKRSSLCLILQATLEPQKSMTTEIPHSLTFLF